MAQFEGRASEVVSGGVGGGDRGRKRVLRDKLIVLTSFTLCRSVLEDTRVSVRESEQKIGAEKKQRTFSRKGKRGKTNDANFQSLVQPPISDSH